MKRYLTGCLLFFLPISLLAEDILIQGLFRDMVIVRIDGKRRKLSIGETSPEGVKLISSTSENAILEINGKRGTYFLGGEVQASFDTPDKAQAMIQSKHGMYRVSGFINRHPIDFLVDTGATWIALNENHAYKLGINFRYIGTPGWVSTASGRAKVYKIKLDNVRIGDIVLTNVDAAVLEGNSPEIALLGMSFLNRVSMKHKGNLLVLEK
jgi:aspartyl protease family protein